MQENNRNKLRVLLLLMMFIIFPIITFLYLKGGVEFRKQSFAEMKNLGKVDRDKLTKSDTISFYKKVLVLLNGNFQNDKERTKVKKLLDQFQNRQDLAFIHLTNDSTLIDDKATDNDYICYIPGFDGDYQTVLDSGKLVLSTNEIALADTTGKILNKYSIDNIEQMKKFVIHTALTIPAVEKKEARFRNQIENEQN